jgi:hypothetical protein
VVVFSERIATLDWLHDQLPAQLKLDAAKQVRVLHGGLADVKQMDVIEEFGLGESKVRLLLTGDMASEGVNLHRQCHHLIHFDLPWSLITIEQRNGRIDRYGQAHPPDIRALVVAPDHPRLSGDVRVLAKLLQREDQAHRAFGESGSLLGLHTPDREEDTIMERLRDGVDVDAIIPERPVNDFDLIALMSGGTGLAPVSERHPPSLFESDLQFVNEAMATAAIDRTALDLRTDDADTHFFSLAPPADLVRRLSALPQSYLTEQKVVDRLKITADRGAGADHLARAQQSEDSQWPDVSYLSPLHPLVEWLVDKVLVGVGRNQAPIIEAGVAVPTFCVQGVWSNGRGRPQLVDWMAVGLGAKGEHHIDDLFAVLAAAGVGPTMANPGRQTDTTLLQHALGGVVEAARAELDRRRVAHDELVDQMLAGPRERLDDWVGKSRQLALDLGIESRRSTRERQIDEVEASTASLIESLRTTGSPLVRVVAALVPAGSRP